MVPSTRRTCGCCYRPMEEIVATWSTDHRACTHGTAWRESREWWVGAEARRSHQRDRGTTAGGGRERRTGTECGGAAAVARRAGAQLRGRLGEARRPASVTDDRTNGAMKFSLRWRTFNDANLRGSRSRSDDRARELPVKIIGTTRTRRNGFCTSVIIDVNAHLQYFTCSIKVRTKYKQ